MEGGREEGLEAYAISVTEAVFHLDTSPLNDDAPENIKLQAGRQAYDGNAAVQHRPKHEKPTTRVRGLA